MRRREFITLLSGAATWPFVARAQQPERMRRLGVLMAVAESDADVRKGIAIFQQRLQELGWKDGQNIQLIIAGVMQMTREFKPSRRSWSTCNPMFWSATPLLRPRGS